MKLRLTLAIVFCALALTVAGWTLARPAGVQWEYKRVAYVDNEQPEEINKKLDALGSEGWEMVQYQQKSGSYFQGLYLFKRQK